MIAENLLKLKNKIPEKVTLVVVSKTRSNDAVMEAYNVGQRIFGENRVPEMVEKQESLPGDIEWHFIGHLQTNKVKYLADFVSMIHSVDSFKVLKEINKRAKTADRVIDVLLQFHIAKEDSKYGLDADDLDFLDGESFAGMNHIRVCGVMGMATFTDDHAVVRSEFQKLRSIFDMLKAGKFSDAPAFREISMGMSGDYEIAIEEGSTMVRVGSEIFGPRD